MTEKKPDYVESSLDSTSLVRRQIVSPALLDQTHAERAEYVLARIEVIKDDLVDKSLELGRLLKEAKDDGLNLYWGFARFGDWVEEASGLDMSERHAYYLINVVEQAHALNIDDDQLRRIKFSKLKAIFALKSADPGVIRDLLAQAENASLKKIEEYCNDVRVADGAEAFQQFSLKIPTSMRGLKDAAFEHGRRLYGDSINGSPIPEWKVWELALTALLNLESIDDPKPDEEVVEGEFEDLIEVYKDNGLIEA